jgi:sugar phosphate isomerase/epimerase
MIPLAYGTYGLAEFTPWASIDLVAEAGFDGIELTLADGYRNAPTRLSREEALRIRERLAATGTDLVGLLARLPVLDGDGEPASGSAETLREVIDSGRRIVPEGELVVTFTMGGRSAQWPEGTRSLVETLRSLGRVAAAEGTVLAVEAHVGGLIDRPERVRWLIEEVGLDSVRINFDISHFTLPGMEYDTVALIRELAPLAVHAHVKDSVPTDNGFRFVLPGKGPFDYDEYFRGMSAEGWQRPVTVEVSAMVFTQPDYDPRAAVLQSFQALSASRARVQTPTPDALEGAE